MQLTNCAAWIPAEGARLSVDHAPFPECGDDEVIIDNHAVAINPVDWKVQSSGGMFGIKYPYILGEDVAGKILEVGSKVEHLKVGQRVIAYALGLGADNAAKGGFQRYPLLSSQTVAAIPDDLSFKEAVVLPLSVSTAAAGLYLKSTLTLRYPEIGENSRDSHPARQKREALLLWGGSSSVGSSVIQLASASGYAVITTASPPNYKYCKRLGAALTFDYHDSGVVDQLVDALKDYELVGAYDAIGSENTARQCAKIVHELGGGQVVSVGSTPEDIERDVKITRIGAGKIVSEEPEVARKIWGHFLPLALASSDLLARPKQLVVGEGLESIQSAMDRQKKGVSARKVVVTL